MFPIVELKNKKTVSSFKRPYMPHTIKIIITIFLGLALASCSSGNDTASSAAVDGKHSEKGWVASEHRAAYRTNQAVCVECHGADLMGGTVSKVDCFNQRDVTGCHASGHGPRLANHEIPFTEPLKHGVKALLDIQGCQVCHGASGGAGSNPRFNVTIGSLTSGCEASGCHVAGQAATNLAHPKPWDGHKTAGNQRNACALCHGEYFMGGLQAQGPKAPSCIKCHSNLLVGVLPQVGDCISCHDAPPSDIALDAKQPRRARSHAIHMGLSELKNDKLAACQFCHQNGGNGTSVHQRYRTDDSGNYSSSPVINIKSTFAVSGSSASYTRTASSVTCSNVKCHGGLETPAWGTANVECASCHSYGTAQHNSYYSGKHYYHLVTPQAFNCKDCHNIDMSVSGRHFSNLSSSTFNQLPIDTLRSDMGLNKSKKSCTAPLSGCHSGVEKSW